MTGDVRDFELAKEATEGIDIVVHLAAKTSVLSSFEDPISDMEVNIRGALNYLEAGRINKIRKFVFVSSNAVLGEAATPMDERRGATPASPYGIGKLTGENYCRIFSKSMGLNTLVLRIGNVYGPGSKYKTSVIAKFFQAALKSESLQVYGDGNQKRNFIYVTDVVDGIVKASESNLAGETFQLATELESTINDIAAHIKKMVEHKLKIVVDITTTPRNANEVKFSFADPSMAQRLLDWCPQVSVETGLMQTMEYFLSLR